ncbi:hypothetical protein HCU64_06775 [Methylobacterium sp. C25]|uniref:hypothetical protein n=1 Tax=Methylobacterium sp. C25 TaxID=2721622 RepID=UPI001F2ABCB5|nr:hypothetical protein [Methylobacterium sp. C25]MCE4223450.1 hypothetical protein [Methylobacterium sp. C25]
MTAAPTPNDMADRALREAMAEKVYAAIEKAQCPGREGPYGLYDYSNYEGASAPHVVRDFRDMRSPDYGKFIFRSDDPAVARDEYDRLTRLHIGETALAAVDPSIAALRAENERLKAVEIEARLNDRPVYSRRKLIAEHDALASELGRVKAALKISLDGARGGNADKSTSDLLRWAAHRVHATHGDGEVPTPAIFNERAVMLDRAVSTARAALQGPKP